MGERGCSNFLKTRTSLKAAEVEEEGAVAFSRGLQGGGEGRLGAEEEAAPLPEQ